MRTESGAPSPFCAAASATLALLVATALLGAGREAEAPPTGEIRIAFVGDTYLGESYHPRGPPPFAPAFRALERLVARSSLVVGNLETSLTARTSSPFAGRKPYLHRGDIASTAAALHSSGISAVSLANNHSVDYGSEGLAETLNALAGHGIAAFGAGSSIRETETAFVRRWRVGAKEFELAVVAGFEYREAYETKYRYYATSDRAGVHPWSPKRAERHVKRVRRAHPRAFVVAFPHWGKNYRWRTEAQRELADALLRGGADLVLGHGAHQLQEIERRRGRWIVYGLGNFVFLSPGRYAKHEAVPYSLIARLVVSSTADGFNLALRLDPILSDNLRTSFRPRSLDDSEVRRVRELLVARDPSGELASSLRFIRDSERSYLLLGFDGESERR